MSHTKGPWIGTQPAGGFAEIRDENGDLVMAVCYPSLGMKDKCRPMEETEANYRAMVATPDLIEALEPFAAFAEHWDARPPGGLAKRYEDEVYTIHLTPGKPPASITLGNLRAARAAIKKARGE